MTVLNVAASSSTSGVQVKQSSDPYSFVEYNLERVSNIVDERLSQDREDPVVVV